MAIEVSDFRALAKIITSETMKTVSAGKKTIIAPTVQRQMTTNMVESAESGSEKRFMAAFDKAEKIIEKLGINVSDFNKGLGDRIKELRTQKDTSAKEVEQLRAENIASETRLMEDNGKQVIQTAILTKKEIETRKKEIIQTEKLLLKEEKEAAKRKAVIMKQETASLRDNELILADQEKIVRIEKDLQEKKDSLGVDTGGQRERGASSTFLQELVAPFAAVGDALMSVRDIANSVTDVFSFFADGGLTKSLKKFAGGVKAVAKFFGSAKVLIGLAIAGVLLLMYKFRDKIGDVASAIMKIPGKIFDFFKDTFVMIKDFFINMINGVIKLLNKVLGVFGADIGLLETSKDKENTKAEQELKAKENREATALMNEGDVTNEEKKQLEDLKQPNEKIMPDKKFSLEDIEAGKVDYSQASMNVDDRKNVNTASADLTAKANQSSVVIQNNTNQSNSSSSGQTQNYIHTDNKNSDNTLLNMNNTAIA